MSFSIGGITFPMRTMIGAGVCKTPATAEKWLQIIPVVTGSYTIEKRVGNEGSVFHPESLEDFLQLGYGLNSLGMPNVGLESALAQIASMKKNHPLIISIAGFSGADYVNMMNLIQNMRSTLQYVNHVDAIELNFGCPNTGHKTTPSFNLDLMREVFVCMPKIEVPIWVKLSPYSDPELLKEVAGFLNAAPVKAVVTCNTFPNSFVGSGVIDPNNGLAGLSGPVLKPIALGQVAQFRKHLDSCTDVIGVGGITSAFDVTDFLSAGASGVQLVSYPFWHGNPATFWDSFLQDAPEEFIQQIQGEL